jgi:predicted histidine transporter YuiF (NhaC family)
MTSTPLFIITISSVIWGLLLCFCFRYCKNRHKEEKEKNRLENFRKRLMIKHKVKPIIQMTDHELKDEYEIRQSQHIGEQNV